jgi:hypothetical protein
VSDPMTTTPVPVDEHAPMPRWGEVKGPYIGA